MTTENLSILWNIRSDTGTFSGGNWESTLPISNLKDNDVKKVARSDGITEADTKFVVDFGTTSPVVLDCFVLLNHNASTAAQWKIVVTNDATDANPASRVYDSGFINMWVPTVLLGTLPWGAFPWDGYDATAYPRGITSIHLTDIPYTARYVWIYIKDTANTDGYFECGRFLSGAIWSPSINYDFGASIRYVDNSEVKRTRGGRRLVTVRPAYRVFEFNLENLNKQEAYGTAFEISRQIGKNGTILVITNPSETGDLLFKRTIYASLTDTAPIIEQQFDRWSWSITAEEQV